MLDIPYHRGGARKGKHNEQKTISYYERLHASN